MKLKSCVSRPPRGFDTARWLLFAFALPFLAFDCRVGMGIYDEGLISYGADRVLNGEVLYRDFWTIYGPGQYYLLAFLYRIFGTTLLVGRLYTVAVQWALVILAFFLGRKLGGRAAGLAACASVAIWLGFTSLPLYPTTPALLLALAGFLVLSKTRSSPLGAAAAGLLTGCAILVRHDLGVYAVLAQCLMVLGLARSAPAATGGRPAGFTNRPWGRLAPFLLAALAVVMPVALAIWRAVPAQQLYEVFISFPVDIYAANRSLPFPTRALRLAVFTLPNAYGWVRANHQILACMMPLVLLCATLALLPLPGIRKHRSAPRFWLAAGLASFGAALLFTARVRPDLAHMGPPGVVALILAPWLSMSIGRLPDPFVKNRAFALLPPALWACVGSLMILCVAIRTLTFVGLPWQTRENSQFRALEGRGAGISVIDQDGMAEAVAYVRRFVPRDESIFVGNMRHDAILISPVMFYFLAERKAAVRHVDLHPGVVTTGETQHEIIQELYMKKVTCVVLWHQPDAAEPNQSSRSTGVTLLDDYIRTNYRLVATFGRFSVLRRTFDRSESRSVTTLPDPTRLSAGPRRSAMQCPGRATA